MTREEASGKQWWRLQCGVDAPEQWGNQTTNSTEPWEDWGDILQEQCGEEAEEGPLVLAIR